MRVLWPPRVDISIVVGVANGEISKSGTNLTSTPHLMWMQYEYSLVSTVGMETYSYYNLQQSYIIQDTIYI